MADLSTKPAQTRGKTLSVIEEIVDEQEPVAWVFELGRARYTDTGEYANWGDPQLSFTKPRVPDESIRNLRPLYLRPASPPADASPEGQSKGENVSLAERWAGMDAERLREECLRMLFAQGKTQSLLYEEIATREQRIHNQRLELVRLQEERDRLASYLSGGALEQQVAELKTEVAAKNERITHLEHAYHEVMSSARPHQVRLEETEARVRELEETLEPFAKWAADMGPENLPDTMRLMDVDPNSPRVGDVRRAARALRPADTEGQSKGERS
jgi:hypothetical protein